MGDVGVDTAVEFVEPGLFRGRLSRDWEIWGPNGGYIASVALRAAAAQAELPRPASFTCQYLAVGEFDYVDAHVVTTRKTKRAEAVAVTLKQGDRVLLTAQAWFVVDGHEGLEHDFAPERNYPHWSDLSPIEDLVKPDDPGAPFPFWLNFDSRPIVWHDNWMDRPAGEPEFYNWYRYRPTATFDDPAADAVRLIVLLDTMSWPAATRAYSGPLPWMAPSLDLAVQFHRFRPESEWLLAYGRADVSADGLFAFRGEVRDDEGLLLASSSGQCFYRAVPIPG